MPWKEYHKTENAKYCHNWYLNNREYNLKSHQLLQQENKRKIISHYSDGKNECACCGEKNLEFLTVNHINGGGCKHFKQIGYGSTFYIWLIKNNYPKGYSILCMNCNHSLGKFGYCPHSGKTKSIFHSIDISNELKKGGGKT